MLESLTEDEEEEEDEEEKEEEEEDKDDEEEEGEEDEVVVVDEKKSLQNNGADKDKGLNKNKSRNEAPESDRASISATVYTTTSYTSYSALLPSLPQPTTAAAPSVSAAAVPTPATSTPGPIPSTSIPTSSTSHPSTTASENSRDRDMGWDPLLLLHGLTMEEFPFTTPRYITTKKSPCKTPYKYPYDIPHKITYKNEEFTFTTPRYTILYPISDPF